MQNRPQTARAASEQRLVIRPPDPLGSRGRRVLFGVLATASLGLGLAFYALGAWPVVGFMGLELLVLYLAFRTMTLRQRHAEEIALVDGQLWVSKHDHHGRTRRIALDPSACQVWLPHPVKWQTTLVLRQRAGLNRPAVIVRLASFLDPDSRARLADQLRGLVRAGCTTA